MPPKKVPFRKTGRTGKEALEDPKTPKKMGSSKAGFVKKEIAKGNLKKEGGKIVESKAKTPTPEAPTAKAPKWTEKLPDKVFLIKDTKRNAISPGGVDNDKLFDIDREKTNFYGTLESGTISDIEKGIKENKENKMRNYDESDKLSVKEKTRAMEKLIKDIRAGRFKFEERKIEKTKTGIKIDGKKYGKTAWENISSFRGGRPLLSRYFVKKIDLTK